MEASGKRQLLGMRIYDPACRTAGKVGGSAHYLQSDSLGTLRTLMVISTQKRYGLSIAVLEQDTWVHTLVLSLPGWWQI